jgi:hypothetical protein
LACIGSEKGKTQFIVSNIRIAASYLEVALTFLEQDGNTKETAILTNGTLIVG